jgi:hypothetical protein
MHAALVFLRNMHWLLVIASIVPSSPILVTLMEALSSSETSVLTRDTQRNFPEDAILHSHCHENLKSYIYAVFTVFIVSSLHEVVPEEYVMREWRMSKFSLLTDLCLQGNISPKTKLSDFKS